MFHIVDDEQWLADIVADVLQSGGYKAKVFTDSVAYLEQSKEDGFAVPDCLFTDIRMPNLSGHELIRQLRSLFPDMCVVAMSGFDDEQVHDPICHFLQKPFKPELLLEIAEAVSSCSRRGSVLVEDVCVALESFAGSDRCPVAARSRGDS